MASAWRVAKAGPRLALQTFFNIQTISVASVTTRENDLFFVIITEARNFWAGRQRKLVARESPEKRH